MAHTESEVTDRTGEERSEETGTRGNQGRHVTLDGLEADDSGGREVRQPTKSPAIKR